MFHVGQKVVCVNAKGGFINLLGERIDTHELTEAQVYTVRWFGIYESTPCIRVHGVRRTAPKPLMASNGRQDPPFAASRFRPVIERKTDISVFTAMLVPASNRDLVKAKG